MKKYILAAAASLLPVVAFAADADPLSGQADSIKATMVSLTNIVNAVVPFLLAIAIVIFIYGVIKYVFQTGAEEKAAARSYIIWGIVGIAVILAVLGLARLLLSAVGVDAGGNVGTGDLPQIQ